MRHTPCHEKSRDAGLRGRAKGRPRGAGRTGGGRIRDGRVSDEESGKVVDDLLRTMPHIFVSLHHPDMANNANGAWWAIRQCDTRARSTQRILPTRTRPGTRPPCAAHTLRAGYRSIYPERYRLARATWTRSQRGSHCPYSTRIGTAPVRTLTRPAATRLPLWKRTVIVDGEGVNAYHSVWRMLCIRCSALRNEIVPLLGCGRMKVPKPYTAKMRQSKLQ